MTTDNRVCRESRKPLEVMEGSEASIRELFEHAERCWACRKDIVCARMYPPGCRTPYLGYRTLHYTLELSLEAKEYPPGSPDGLNAHRDLLLEHRLELEALVPSELVEHVIECPACTIDMVSVRRVLGEYDERLRQRESPPT